MGAHMGRTHLPLRAVTTRAMRPLAKLFWTLNYNYMVAQKVKNVFFTLIVFMLIMLNMQENGCFTFSGISIYSRTTACYHIALLL